MFIQPVASITGLHAKSPLLFWTIILIASHEHGRLAFLYPELITGVETVLSSLLLKAIQRLEDIQALLLLCLWPIPQSQYFQNPAWNYVGLASHAAMQLHFHSPPDSESEQNPWPGVALTAEGETNATERALTWLACFRVGTAVAIMSGLPSPISSQVHMRSIEKAIQTASNTVPPSWGVILPILKFMNSALDTLGGIEDHELHCSLTRMLNEQVDKIKQDNLDSWGSELEIEWCNAKLYLLALTFTTPSTIDSVQNDQIRIQRQVILQNAFEVASNLITQYITLSQLSVSDSNPGGMLKFIPELYVTPLFNCTTIIFRFMATSVTLTSAKRIQAMNLIIEAHKTFQSYPDRREFTRAAIHIESFIDILKQGVQPGISELAVKNKLGASIMFDALFHACRQRNIDPRTGEPLDVREWSTINERFAQRLPEGRINRPDDSSVGDNNPQDQPVMLPEQDQWWDEWDNYIDFFQVGDHNND
ncbi:hypothetical protein N7540_010783 [Penicillium herquei]|nr:hypothetical protein N7540_010783 [Penicillium herquei]